MNDRRSFFGAVASVFLAAKNPVAVRGGFTPRLAPTKLVTLGYARGMAAKTTLSPAAGTAILAATTGDPNPIGGPMPGNEKPLSAAAAKLLADTANARKTLRPLLETIKAKAAAGLYGVEFSRGGLAPAEAVVLRELGYRVTDLVESEPNGCEMRNRVVGWEVSWGQP